MNKFFGSVAVISLLVSSVSAHSMLYEGKNYSGGLVQGIPYPSSGNGNHGSPALVPYVGNMANDRISSIMISHGNQIPDKCLIVYEHENFHGRNYVIYGNVPDLDTPAYRLDNSISSFIEFKQSPYVSGVWTSFSCESSVAIIYEDDNSGGYRYHLPFGQLMPRLAWFNDKASSVTVPAGGCLKVWENSPPSNSANYSNWYDNPSMTFTQGSFNMRSYNLNDKISAFELKECY